ncbi:hypothetical protein RND81_08G218000 [Saponaria officinalis]|uniref:Uncharacterized protein n=1 Tax=Saponaria officinalis TaxID=3572 RepID=A0AAW1JBS2_SAPOF
MYAKKMVFVKRPSENRLNSCRSPIVPRAPRSIRKRNWRQKSREGSQLCPFELLATVAGKLLEESKCSSASSSAAVGFDKYDIGKDGIKEEPVDVDKSLRGEHDDQGSSEGSVYFSGIEKGSCKGKLKEHVSPLVSSVLSEKVDSESKLATQKNDDDFVWLNSKIIRDFPFGGESDDTNVGNELNRKLDVNGDFSGNVTVANKSAAPNNSREIPELPFSGKFVSKDSFLKCVNNDVKIGCKDDDEIFSRFSQHNNIRKIFRSPTRVGDRRFRKLQTSKYWKTAPKLKDCEVTNSAGVSKYDYHNKRSCYEIDRSQRNTPFKKRKLFDRSSIVTYNGGISCESVSNSPEKSRDDDKNAFTGKLHDGNGKLPSGFRRHNSCNSRNSHVSLSIKSFKVPELFVEVPESTTVGSLKRTVLEAVTSILGGGLRVGVLLHGKKIRDDNRTLLQTGISQNDDIDTIGFMLEPNSPTQPSTPISPKQPPNPLLCNSPKVVNRSPYRKEDKYLLGSLDKPSVTDSNIPVGSSRELVPSTTVELPEKDASDSKALVPVPERNTEALAILPVNQRSKRFEIGHRRTRRPFSVSEVEALVHAVEKLGTGRWRDVKLCSFENAKHRTYVDLKDKWKTLVHTASISPQQRRGEPVPQELLDRVLAAQAFWSEHQGKQHGKTIPKLTDSKP